MKVETPSTSKNQSGLTAPSEREASLWLRLQLDPYDRDAKEDLINEYLPIVKAELGRISYLLPRHVDRQELYAEGMIGLMAAVNNFEPSKGVFFVAYARNRVWGAMMDRVRSLDGVPRSARKAARKLTRAINVFLSEKGRHPDESELAHHLGLSVEDLHKLERKAALTQALSLDSNSDYRGDSGNGSLGDQLADQGSPSQNPLERMASLEMRGMLVDALKELPERERSILVLYYQQNLMLKEIAEAMEVSESRVSQLHSRALLRMRAYFEKNESEADNKHLNGKPRKETMPPPPNPPLAAEQIQEVYEPRPESSSQAIDVEGTPPKPIMETKLPPDTPAQVEGGSGPSLKVYSG